MLNLFRTILILLFAAFITFAQQGNYNFEHISLIDGLSQSTVTSIYQDNEGFLWFGTGNGLNKYDGYNFTVYKHNPSDPYSLSNDYINIIYNDSRGNLWIGTEGGLNKYDGSGKFTRYVYSPKDNSSISNNRIMTIDEDKTGNLWIGTYSGGLNLYNYNTNKFTRIENSLKDKSLLYIWASSNDRNRNLWLGTAGGLLKFNTKTREQSLFKIPGISGNDKIISAISVDGENILWAGTGYGSIFKFDLLNEKFTPFSNAKIIREYSKGKWLNRIYSDSKNNLWICIMDEGLIQYNKITGALTQIKNDRTNQGSLSDNNIMSVLEDRSGILWFGTGASGINKFAGGKVKFNAYKYNPGKKWGLNSTFVYSLLEDHKGKLWVGTTSGINMLDRKTGGIKYINEQKNGKGLTNKYVICIYEDNKNNIWAGTRYGLNKFDQSGNFKKAFIKDSQKNNSLGGNIITNIMQDEKGYLWLGTNTNVLTRFNPETEEFTNYLIDSINTRTYVVYESKDGFLWLGTTNGLFKFDRNTGNAKKYVSNENDVDALNNDFIFTLYDDGSGSLWAGTYGGGLNKFNMKSGKAEHFSENEGLPNNVVYSILPDHVGNLWLSTNKGLCKFNMNTHIVRNYDISDGLQGYEFNSGAYYLNRKGEMFFGGLNGINYFYPSGVIDNPYIPSVVITSVMSFDRDLHNDGGLIKLSYNHNFISFDFVSLDYTNPRNNQYKYMLEGFDKTWINAGTRRFANYTNLEPGEYKFRVLGSNNDQVWNSKGASVSFIIYPPFWRTWWFYLLVLAFGAGIILSVHKYRISVKIAQLVQLENIRKRIADDFHDELGHKLTKISLYSELMKKDLTGKLNGTEDYLVKINETANTLYDDTKDFIWSIDPGKDTLYDLAVYLKDFGDELFDKTGVSFRVEEISVGLEKIILPMVWKRQLILIFKEAMNNVLKHSRCSTVNLEVGQTTSEIEIVLTDDGAGMQVPVSTRGRGLGNMKNRAEKIEGELIIDSHNNGTIIRFIGSLEKMSKYYETT
jgi:ligand-binding sensor domain-containing protein/anti-sigma regulatory factor (Ser/Thr protein kinase)